MSLGTAWALVLSGSQGVFGLLACRGAYVRTAITAPRHPYGVWRWLAVDVVGLGTASTAIGGGGAVVVVGGWGAGVRLGHGQGHGHGLRLGRSVELPDLLDA